MNRTVCACERCKACCKIQPGPLAPGDLERIAEFLGETPEQAKEHFMASAGCVARLRDGRVVRIGSITPKRKADGSCVFLDKDKRCMIHPVAPFGCAYFDVHMDKDEGLKRSGWLAMKQATDREYRRLRAELISQEVNKEGIKK